MVWSANKKALSGGQGFCRGWKRSGRGGLDAHHLATGRALDLEMDRAVNLGEQGVVLANADIVARVELGAALTHEDVAGRNQLTAVALHAQAFRF